VGDIKSAADERPMAGQSFLRQVGPVVFLVVIFFLNFVSRIILAPLLPTIEKELAISHGQAGFFFFLISAGYLAGLLLSGFLSSRLTHRSAIIASGAGVGVSMLALSAAGGPWTMRCGFFALGFASGLYMPSAIAAITSLFDRRHWGKAIAVHELAPNLAFFSAPFIAELFLRWFTWRAALGALGAAALMVVVAFSRFGRGGDFPGEPPTASAVGLLLRSSSFWLMVLLFGVGVSVTVGVYAMLPLYLINERQMDSTWANTIVALSRVHGPFLGLLGGWVSDRLGPKRTIVISLLFSGVATLLLGWPTSRGLSVAVFVQPLLAVWFFPAGFAALAMITPPQARNLSVGFTVPFGFLIGGGAIPTFIGIMGDAGSFALGLMVTGVLILGAGIAGLWLKLPDRSQPST
jgi:NNP family nitrate/nitrite transporter-like MFS transporter